MDAPPFDPMEFFNFDMLPASSSSRSSSNSPAHSPDFPTTPPQLNVDSLFTFGMFDNDYTKADPLAYQAPLMGAQPYDFSHVLSTPAMTSFANSFTSSSPAASSSATAVSPTLAIDPQLVDSPSPPHDDEDDDEDQDEEEVEEAASAKVGGKGKNRKGTVQSGGVQKKVRAAEKKEKTEEPDDWRPSPEEYKKMSSKEKRQLRNKISARNFRNRRKG
jgi:hypothetical protein